MIQKITFTINRYLLHLLDEVFAEEKTHNKRILRAIVLALNICQNYFPSEPYYAFMLLINRQDMSTKRVTIRIDQQLLYCISARGNNSKTFSIITGNPLHDAIICCIAEGIYIKKNDHFHFHRRSPISIPGNKGNSRMLYACYIIMQGFSNLCPSDWHIVETCVGSCTLTLNIQYPYGKYLINDDDWEKFNFFRVVRDRFKDLTNELLGLAINRATYDALKAEAASLRLRLQSSNPTATEGTTNDEPDVQAAAVYFYINAASVRNGSSFNDSFTKQKYLKKLCALYLLHDTLAGVSIYNEDIFAFLRHYIDKRHTLFIVDPPYLFCTGYESRATKNKREFGFEEHVQLAGLLKDTVKCGNHILYFCRTTMRPDTAIKNPDTRAKSKEAHDKYLTNLICKLYHDVGLYFTDVRIDRNVTERIITSFPFPDAKSLDADGLCTADVDLSFWGKGAY